MLGSSRIYRTPESAEPICVARRILWLSPPDSVPAERESVRYESPTLLRKFRRLSISFVIAPAISFSRSERSCEFLVNSSAFSTDISQNSLIFMPPTVTARLSGESLLPLQASQGTDDI